MLSVKQGGINYHFLSLWYDLTWDRTQVSQTTDTSNNYFKYKYFTQFCGFNIFLSNDLHLILSFQLFLFNIWFDCVLWPIKPLWVMW